MFSIRPVLGLLLCIVSSLAPAQNIPSASPATTTPPASTPLNSTPPTPPLRGSVDEVLSNQQFSQVCSTEKQFHYFQRACLIGQASNAPQISDAWIIFRARNRDALATLNRVCQGSKRWPALMNQMAQDEHRANLEWRQKTPEQVEGFCGRLPEALLSAELEESLRKFASAVK